MAPVLLIGLHRLPTVESRVRPRVASLHGFWQSGEYHLQMGGDLFPGRPLAFAQFARNVFARLRQKRQDR